MDLYDARDKYNKGDKKGAAISLGSAAVGLIPGSGPAKVGIKGGAELAGVGTKTLYRSMSKAEAVAVKETGKLRGGLKGETYFTDSRITSATNAKERLSLKTTPEVQMEFTVKNDLNMSKNGTRVAPDFGNYGAGKEYMTTDPVEVDVINVQPY